MRFDVSSTALLSRLQSISKVIASKNSLPILDNFLFNLEGNTLTVTASDAETRLVTSVDVMNAQGAGLLRAIYRAVFRRRRNVLRAASGKRNHRRQQSGAYQSVPSGRRACRRCDCLS